MPKADDPYYNRKRVPDEFVKDVGVTDLTPQEEFYSRERKYSDQNGVDVRRFFGGKKSGLKPQDDPYYGRKRVSDAEIHGVAETGLTPDEEFSNRERKYSVNGVDVRKFSTSNTGGLEPLNDPYYGRKPVSSKLTKGIGETGYTPAEEFEVRERKQSVVNFSGDPFQQLIGTGHRQSISGGAVAGAAAAATRRRSSAGPMDGSRQGSGQGGLHSGYAPDNKLGPIESRPELPPVEGVGRMDGSSGSSAPNGHTRTTTTTTTTTSTSAHQPHAQEEYDDPDAVAPDSVGPRVVR